jgi:membrane fusion protein (multidrug efflux system)
MNNVAKMKSAETASAEARTEGQPARKKRGRRILLMLLVPLAFAAGGAWMWLSGGRYEKTENAYLHQARMTIASDLSGRVTEVQIADNATVHEGDVLFRIDPKPYRLALAEADAAIAGARLEVEQMKAAYQKNLAQEEAARDEVDYLAKELERQRALADRGVATAATLDSAEHGLSKAREQLIAAEQATASARAALGNDPAAPSDAHPIVQSALATRARAAYNLELATVRAPADGVVYQAASFRDGQFVAAGEPLFSLVLTGDSWVDANFKETQLTQIAKGQPAEVTFDIYPGRTFPATVEAIGAGTGAEFSLLPAQNATGNWVKVTQRVPVRVRFDGPMPEGVDLMSGASATVTVDTGVTRTLSGLAAFAANAK